MNTQIHAMQILCQPFHSNQSTGPWTDMSSERLPEGLPGAKGQVGMTLKKSNRNKGKERSLPGAPNLARVYGRFEQHMLQ